MPPLRFPFPKFLIPFRPHRFEVILRRFALLLLAACASSLHAGGPPIASPDEFPPPGSAHYLAGELTLIDHVNRRGILRPDRLDHYNKYHWDLPHHFVLLPYGSVHYHGAPAALHHVPIGTHLHGWFYLGPEGEFEPELTKSNYIAKTRNRPNLRSPDAQFSSALRFEDDFTFYQRQGVGWKILSIDPEEEALTARRVKLPEANPETLADPPLGLTGEQTFDYDEATRVWRERRIGSWDEVAPGQIVQINLTWATLYGPGRLTDVWIDAESRRVASETQARLHRQHQRRRGVPGRVDAVDHQGGSKGVVTVTLYAGSDPKLYEELESGTVLAAVVEPSLRSYDQAGDARGGPVLDVRRNKNPPPGSSGIQLDYRMHVLLEGIRPGRTVRLFDRDWPRPTLPREEHLYPWDVRVLWPVPDGTDSERMSSR